MNEGYRISCVVLNQMRDQRCIIYLYDQKFDLRSLLRTGGNLKDPHSHNVQIAMFKNYAAAANRPNFL
jgi:hypothetical protein